MNTPAWLQAIALLLWGSTLGLGSGGIALGASLGGIRMLVSIAGTRLRLSERELTRGVDVTVLLVMLTLVGQLASKGLPAGLLVATGWLPAALLPLLLLVRLNDAPLRWRHVALSLRRSSSPQAALPVDAEAPYLAMTLLATVVLAKPSALVFAGLAVVLVGWLWLCRPPPGRRALARFAGAALLALGLAFAAAQGLQRAQLLLQDWVIEVFFTLDSDPYRSQTRIGDLGRLKLSERIVWRVEQSAPVEVPLLLRTGVFTQYLGGQSGEGGAGDGAAGGATWLARRDAFTPLGDVSTAGTGADPAIPPPRLILHGDSERASVLLPVPLTFGRIATAGRLERNPLGVIRLSDAPARLDVRLTRGGGNLAAPPTAGDLALPPEFAGLLAQLPALAALRSATARDRVAGLRAWFAANFRYTLALGDEGSDTGGRRDLPRFLLTERAGHCEYFATATVLLLRALNVPARYVTGYSVQEYSRLEKAFLVRQRHAHAWAEAFVDGRWVEVDNTPSNWLTVEENATPFWQPALDLLSFAWRRAGDWRQQLSAAEHASWGWALAALLLAALVWRLGRRLRRAARPTAAASAVAPPSSAEGRALAELEQQLARLGLPRHASEAPQPWIDRVAREGASVLDEATMVAARQVVADFYRRRYGLAAEAGQNAPAR